MLRDMSLAEPFAEPSAKRRAGVLPAGCLAALAALGAPAVAAARSGQDACRSAALREDRLEAVGPRGEIVLASGTRAVLSGLRWPEAEPEAAQAAAWLMRFRARALTLGPRGEEDRWGRARIDAVADPVSEEDEPLDLAGGLVAAGLARADSGESDALCRPDLLALEAEPRAAGLGVWRGGVLEARDGAALRPLAGRFVVAQGRIVSVGERPGRTYLDFVRRHENGLAVTVPKRTWRIMQERGLTAATLRGRLARVRGMLEIRRGPTLDIVSADMIEVENIPEGEGSRGIGLPRGEQARSR